MRWAGHVARVGERKVVYGVLVGKSEEKIPLGRPRREDNIKMDFQQVGWWAWIELILLRIRSGSEHLYMR
jgi:hypothetical protein